MRISDWISYVCSSDLSDADLQGYDDMPPDQYEMLKAGNKASYAFRDKIDTDGFDHPKKIYELAEELIRRGYSDANIQAVRWAERRVWKEGVSKGRCRWRV